MQSHWRRQTPGQVEKRLGGKGLAGEFATVPIPLAPLGAAAVDENGSRGERLWRKTAMCLKAGNEGGRRQKAKAPSHDSSFGIL